MREIKFRAKYFDEWYFGIIVTRKVKDRGRMRNLYILMGLDNENWIPLNEDQYDTIGQFTGLHDKNGKEIYEGDILRSKRKTLNYIAYDDDKGRFVEVRIWDAAIDARCEISKYKIERLGQEVIGNIHDNPELMEANQ